MIKFILKQTEAVIMQDKALESMTNNLLSSETMTYENVIEIIFNSEILGDSVMEKIYVKAGR